jgi:hypothetical protein
MKKFSMLMTFVLAAGVAAFAAAADTPTAAKSTSTKAATHSAVKTHPVSGEFVSYDAAKKELTLKTDTGDVTSPVQGRALTQVKTLKAGDKVIATCRDKADGTHEATIGIKKAPAAKAPAAKS